MERMPSEGRDRAGVACLPAEGHNIPAVPRSQGRGAGPILLRLPQGSSYAAPFFFLSFILTILGEFQVDSKGTQPCISMYPFFARLHIPSRLPHNFEQSSLRCVPGPCCSCILRIAVTSLSIPNSLPSLPLILPLCVSTSWFQISCFQHCDRINLCL